MRSSKMGIILLGIGIFAGLTAHSRADATFKYRVDRPGLTSAGIYDLQGHLVKVLWTMKPTTSGRHDAIWDGKTSLGQDAPAGKYVYHVVVNHSTYKNIGVIGNTGQPTTTAGHVPINFESVAAGPDGSVYTVHDWDEPHFDVIKWSPLTGQAVSNSGHPFGGLLKGVAVDGAHVYFTGYENIGDPKNAKFSIGRLKLNPDGSMPADPFTKPNGPIVVYNGVVGLMPAGTSAADGAVMGMPLLSLAVSGDTLLATDALGGKVRRYDKATGEEKTPILVRLPQAVAVAPDGKVWVGHEHSLVSVFDTDGKLLGTPITDLKEVNALAVGPDSRLYVADQGAGQVKIYKTDGAGGATLGGTLGQPFQPGDSAADRFIRLHGLAVDSAGNVITAQDEFFFNGGRLAKWSPAGKLLWEQMGMEFQSQGTYSASDPDTFYTYAAHAYHLDRKTGTAAYIANTYDNSPYRSSSAGVPHIVRVGAHDFAYMPMGDGMNVYRIDRNAQGKPVFKLASLIHSGAPGPSGVDFPETWRHPVRWSWHDAVGDHTVKQEQIVYVQRDSDGKPLWQHGPMCVEPSDKSLWFSSNDRGGWGPGRMDVWTIPMSGLDAQGNPIYDWNTAKEVVPYDSSPIQMQPNMAVHAPDGTIYVYGHSAAWPNHAENGGVWMGGNTLAHFDKTGARLWAEPLPEVAVGMDVIPGGQGGLMIGGRPWGGIVQHYTSDGLMIGEMAPSKDKGVAPNNPSGLLDAFLAVNTNRDPRDGILDVFVEDDYNLRIEWYRVDDHDIQTLTGTVNLPVMPPKPVVSPAPPAAAKV